MADNGEDYGIQQGNGGNERVTTLETQMPQLSLMDVAVFEIEWSKHTGITRLYFNRNLFFYTRPSPAVPHFLLYLHGSLLPPMPLTSLLIILEAALAEAPEHALQELADNPEHQQYNYNISHSFPFYTILFQHKDTKNSRCKQIYRLD